MKAWKVRTCYWRFMIPALVVVGVVTSGAAAAEEVDWSGAIEGMKKEFNETVCDGPLRIGCQTDSETVQPVVQPEPDPTKKGENTNKRPVALSKSGQTEQAANKNNKGGKKASNKQLDPMSNIRNIQKTIDAVSGDAREGKEKAEADVKLQGKKIPIKRREHGKSPGGSTHLK